MRKRPCHKYHYEFHQDSSFRWVTKSGVYLSEVVSSDALRALLMTPYKVLFRMYDSSFFYEVRRLGDFRIVVNITKYLDNYEN